MSCTFVHTVHSQPRGVRPECSEIHIVFIEPPLSLDSNLKQDIMISRCRFTVVNGKIMAEVAEVAPKATAIPKTNVCNVRTP
jgi:hypothetical protein